MTEPDASEPPRGTPPTASSVLDRERAQRASESDAALSRYGRRMRRQRAIYYPIVGAVLLGLVIAFVVAYLHGETHNVRLDTVADPPARLAVGTPDTDQQRLWHTTDRAALGDPLYHGTVVVWGGRTMRGVNARTGKQTWSYYRSDRTICSAAQIGGVAVAIYKLAGNCDELTALDAGTGEREWTRTLDFNGQPLFGQPTFQADVPDESLMITSPTVIYSIQVGKNLLGADGEDRFTYSHFGCRIDSAVLGSQGALISQTCSNPRCKTGADTLKFCGPGKQLLLRGSPTSDVDDDSDTNPNRIVWNDFGDTDIPVSGGEVLTAGNRTTGELDLLSDDKGSPAGSIDVGVDGSAWAGASSSDLADGSLLVDTGSRVALVRDGGSKPVWTATSQGRSSVSGASAVVPTAAGVQLRVRATGTVQHTYPLNPAAPAGSTLYRLGSGFLATTTSGTTAYS